MLALSLLLCTCFLASFTTSQTCYWPDGTTNNYTPCPGVDEDNPGPCCSESDTKDPCLQGEGAVGNCLSLYGFIYRGGCTDPNWEAANCAKACWTDESGGMIYPCGSNYGSSQQIRIILISDLSWIGFLRSPCNLWQR